MTDTEKGNVTSNLTADTSNKVAVNKSSKKLRSGRVNDGIEKKGTTISGGRPDQINLNPSQNFQEQSEHTAVTNLNMRAQPVHSGHAKLIKAVEDEAKRVGGSAHIVASHSEGDSKNPIPTDKKIDYLKKVAAPGTRVSATSKAAPSIFHTAARLNRHAHHLVVVAGSDRADEYEKLLNRYNGKEGPHGYYNFKSITVKKIDRDPDAEGTKGVSGTKMRKHAIDGNISGFKSGLPPELHQHAEEMMNDINKASKKKMKESLDRYFEDTFIDTEDTLRVLEAIDAAHREAVPRSNQERKKMDIVPRSGQDRKKDTGPYRQQSIVNKIIESAWEKMLAKNPKYNDSEKRAQKAKAGLAQANADYEAMLRKEAEADAKKKKTNEDFSKIDEGKQGLWANIHAKRERIKRGSGERMRKPGSEGAPTAKDFKDSQ
jgi:hypothetical protein